MSVLRSTSPSADPSGPSLRATGVLAVLAALALVVRADDERDAARRNAREFLEQNHDDPAAAAQDAAARRAERALDRPRSLDDRLGAPADLDTDCVGCHETLHPELVAAWRASSHADSDVDCATCHGVNHSLTFRDNGRVSPAVCGKCHETAVEEFARSSHAGARRTLESSALFAATPLEARHACFGCHDIGIEHADGSRGNCNGCHSGHRFDATDAREPEACMRCHTGEDYPQDTAYRLSSHGVLYLSTRDERVAPTCATCHHPGGTHDDGRGLTLGSMGVGRALEGAATPFPMDTVTADEFARERKAMVDVCSRCHSRRRADESLRTADAIKVEGERLLGEAARVLRELHEAGRLGGAPRLALGPSQTLPAPDAPGRELLERFYRMWRFHFTWTWKGAYHNSPSVSNQQSRPDLSHDLAAIREAARRLKEAKR